MSDDDQIVSAPITIALTPDGRGHWFASLDGANAAGGWRRTPEAAVIVLMDKLREDYAELAERSTRRHDTLTDDENRLLLWLVGLFG